MRFPCLFYRCFLRLRPKVRRAPAARDTHRTYRSAPVSPVAGWEVPSRRQTVGAFLQGPGHIPAVVIGFSQDGPRREAEGQGGALVPGDGDTVSIFIRYTVYGHPDARIQGQGQGVNRGHLRSQGGVRRPGPARQGQQNSRQQGQQQGGRFLVHAGRLSP